MATPTFVLLPVKIRIFFNVNVSTIQRGKIATGVKWVTPKRNGVSILRRTNLNANLATVTDIQTNVTTTRKLTTNNCLWTFMGITREEESAKSVNIIRLESIVTLV